MKSQNNYRNEHLLSLDTKIKKLINLNKLAFIIALLTILFPSDSRENTKYQYDSISKPDQVYLLKSIPDYENNLLLIEFTIPEDDFVKITVANETGEVIETPVTGEVEKGRHCVYLKTDNIRNIVNCKCIMEVYSVKADRLIRKNEIQLIR